ncbi:transcriptional regulator MelR [Rodentibacter caecimuris]|uniref:Transcriptional regulator MelR n=1 Tax=Rodentibacter caecimuris TaxID=1796644 RepID=A0A1V3KCX4_9PAST|nr:MULTISPECIES: transcriptional regulator MelR [Pasteurellaceae]AOF54179.1 Melibiose operon regulatory protein [Pasteurellaceae bacterium NI1060]MBF0752202.1 transcriptional regulator MelR [Pasteurella sp. 19428wF3_WM03]OOF52523.1 transcriptional regulator MelR [Rodentibacter genomosp. 2]TFU50440.1 transcriptional regulator MelR [Pasteurella sp. WM03]MCQ9122978.1 transcriptional regulator MelR [Rodentibacter heylii]
MQSEDIVLDYFDPENALGSKTTSPLSLPLEKQSLRVKLWQPPLNMPAHHWHGHIEINIPFNDDVTYFYNGSQITVKKNHIAVFWAAIPHSLVDRKNCTEMAVIDIPVHQFLSWQLTDKLVTHITHGVVIQSQNPALAGTFEIMRWENELTKEDKNRNQLVYSEVQLLLKRLELDGWELLLKTNYENHMNGKSSRHTQYYVIQMLNYIASHFNQALTVSQVAAAVGLNTNYAMGLFQRVMQLTIKQYITMMRINHAKALLTDTDKTMLDISLTAGFNSLSRFYENFQKYTGLSPVNYRKQMRGNLPIHHLIR